MSGINIYIDTNCIELIESENESPITLIVNAIENCKNTVHAKHSFAVKSTEDSLSQLYSYFPKVIACGGIVMNEHQDILFIYRRKKWDLPKGKLDKGETYEACAIREVQEETGIQQVQLGEFCCTCYHIYFDKWQNREVLKETKWFYMQAASTAPLQPQLEEDIESIEWIANDQLQKVYDNTFESIKEVLSKM